MLEQWLWARQAMTFDFSVALFAERYQIAQHIRFVVITIKQTIWNDVVNIYNQMLSGLLLFAAYLTDFAVSLLCKFSLSAPGLAIQVAPALSPMTVKIHRIVIALHPFCSTTNRAETAASTVPILRLMDHNFLAALDTRNRDKIFRSAFTGMRSAFSSFACAMLRAIRACARLAPFELLTTNRACFHGGYSLAGLAYRGCEQAAKQAFRAGSNSALAHLKIVPQGGG